MGKTYKDLIPKCQRKGRYAEPEDVESKHMKKKDAFEYVGYQNTDRY